MQPAELADFYHFLNNEENRLENLFIIKWNNIYSRRNFDTLDLLDLIELKVQIDYFAFLRNRIQVLLEYLYSAY